MSEVKTKITIAQLLFMQSQIYSPRRVRRYYQQVIPEIAATLLFIYVTSFH